MHKTIFDKFNERPSGVRFPSGRNVSPHFNIEEFRFRSELDDNVQNEYCIRCELGINFYANPAQYDRKRETAFRQLQLFLYEDILSDLEAAIALCGDEEVLDKLLTIRSKVYPK